MAPTTARAATYRVLGTTDEVTECEHCGRVDLKGTIKLAVLDADGNVEDVTYFGAVCGARAAGWTVKDFRRAAKNADDDRRDAERRACREASEAAENAFMAEFIPWVRETYGIAITQVANLNDHRRVTGKTAYAIRAEFEDIRTAR